MAMKLTKTLCASAAALFCLLSFVSCRQDAAHASGPAAPVDVKVFNRLVAVLGHENRTLELVDPASGEKVKSIRLGQPPNGMALDGSTAYVAEGGPRGVVEAVTGSVAIKNAPSMVAPENSCITGDVKCDESIRYPITDNTASVPSMAAGICHEITLRLSRIQPPIR